MRDLVAADRAEQRPCLLVVALVDPRGRRLRATGGDDPRTLLVDEADTIFGSRKAAEANEDLRGLLNAGHQRNRPAIRYDPNTRTVERIPTFRPDQPERRWDGWDGEPARLRTRPPRRLPRLLDPRPPRHPVSRALPTTPADPRTALYGLYRAPSDGPPPPVARGPPAEPPAAPDPPSPAQPRRPVRQKGTAMTTKLLLTVEEAADRLGIGRTLAYALV